VVENTGDVALDDVTLADPLLGISTNLGSLAVGGAVTSSAPWIVAGSATNMATVTAEDPNGGVVLAGDTAVLQEIKPEILVTKKVSLNGTLGSAVDMLHATNGAEVVYWFVVENIGDVVLTDVRLADPQVGLATNLGTLAVGHSVTSNVPWMVTGNQTNTVMVSGADPNGDPVFWEDTAEVREMTPSIAVAKRVGLGGSLVAQTNFLYATHGTEVVYWFVVENTGDVALDAVVLQDAQIGFTATLGTLAPGAVATSQVPRMVTASIVNTVTVRAKDPNGNPLSASDTAEVRKITPAIGLSKTVSEDVYPGSSFLPTTKGAEIVYWFRVENMGDIDLDDVKLEDPALGLLYDIGSIAAGEVVVTNMPWIVERGFVNTARVVGTAPNGLQVAAQDMAEVRVPVPALVVVSMLWQLNFATGLFEGQLRMRNMGDGAVPSDYDYWFALPVTPEWRLWNPTGMQPNRYTFVNLTTAVRQALRVTGNRDAIWDPWEDVTIGGLMIYHRRRVNPSLYVDPLAAFGFGRLYHPLDLNRDFVMTTAERDAALADWLAGTLSHRMLLEAGRLSQGEAYFWSQELENWEVIPDLR